METQDSIFEIVENFNGEGLSKLKEQQSEQDFRSQLTSKNEHGQTVLHVACQLGYTKMIIQILEYLESLSLINEVIDSVDSNHFTPLILVIKSTDDGIPEAVEVLLKFNANPNVQDKDGNTALHYAASMGQEECCEILLNSNKININSQNSFGETPLIQSIIEGQFNIINMLLNHKIDLEIQDKKGRSAIHYAAITKGNSPAYIRCLAEKCDLNKRDQEGNTPLLLAASLSLKKHYRAIELLINLNVDLTAKNKQNKLAQNYVEQLDLEDKKTEYYSILRSAFKKKGIILLEEGTNEKREAHKKYQMEQEINVSSDEKSSKKGGCCSTGSCSSASNSEDKQVDDQKNLSEKQNKKSGCCSDSSSCCGDGNSTKKEKNSCCSDNGNSSCNTQKQQKSEGNIQTAASKKGYDFQEKLIIAALVPLNIVFFYLLFQVFMQSK
ncbi:ankyrin domain protein (macronuclear) [Tetrahymena thermophila SB210]|uniref:Ankyrin domain protein n=1 Tax=Tetrahymena thermophila (strain SB210) TaxID=312017 RepID=I7LU46_TETTS|nr:ankyrin domain protein [Tetrahymena thermophila SB210]EAR89400.1 ankyrin domain protein [Tetrahymena thermophila SB210]|eukprot:XP_001009645.1 ankyrin domain protein [Tetrahymena thermophila SB210]